VLFGAGPETNTLVIFNNSSTDTVDNISLHSVYFFFYERGSIYSALTGVEGEAGNEGYRLRHD
jgi:hypothetical protein